MEAYMGKRISHLTRLNWTKDGDIWSIVSNIILKHEHKCERITAIYGMGFQLFTVPRNIMKTFFNHYQKALVDSFGDDSHKKKLML